MPKRFDCRREVNLAARPEEVWNAIATSEGNAGWLYAQEIDSASVEIWDPPHRFATRTERGEWFNAVEFVVEGRSGAETLLRYAHSGIFVDDWENQYDAVSQHTDFYLHTLGQYLTHFPSRIATYVGETPAGIVGPKSSASRDGFARLQAALGVTETTADGSPITIAPAGLERIDGIVDYRRPNFLGIRTDDALYRFFGRNAFGAPVGMSIHSFATGLDPELTAERWKRFLDTSLSQPPTPSHPPTPEGTTQCDTSSSRNSSRSTA
jgi:hypothetical protein